MNNKTEITSYLSRLPPLSSPLKIIYFNLDLDMRRVFLMLFRYLWNYVCPLSRFVDFSGVLYSFWAVDLFRMKYRLTSSELAILIYQISAGNNRGIIIDRENNLKNALYLTLRANVTTTTIESTTKMHQELI